MVQVDRRAPTAAAGPASQELGVRLFATAPKGFDPVRATPRELRQYGYPDRPDDRRHPHAFLQWLRVVSAPTVFIEPTFGQVPILSSGGATQGPPPFPTSGVSPTWAGVVAFAEPGTAIKTVSGQWTVPNIDVTDSNAVWACATWIGLDGQLPDPDEDSPFPINIAQVGTTRAAFDGNNVTFPWFQWFPDAAVSITNFPVWPGDVMHCTLSAWSPTEVFFLLRNQTTGTTAALLKRAHENQRVRGYSAEWILELPSRTDGPPVDLPPYGAVYFDNCVATVGGGGTIDAGPGELISMVNAVGTEISFPTMISDTTMRVDFTHIQVGGFDG